LAENNSGPGGLTGCEPRLQETFELRMSIYAAIDTGGTFTDLVMFDAASGNVRYTKSLTTRQHPIDGIMDCIRKVDLDLSATTIFKHGTTLVINTLLERSGPVVALVTTRGFRDILEFGRGNRTEPFNLFFRRDPPLVERELRFEIEERIDGQGNVLVAPKRDELLMLAEQLRKLGVAAVAICFINSYLNPDHEQQVAQWLRDALPSCYVSSSIELTREWYEYERTATVAANCYTGPEVGAYIGSLDTTLKGRGFNGQLLLMGSNGGVLSVQHAAAAPVLLVESGPVGGCIGAGAYGMHLGFDRLIAFDMGGTTAKCAIVRDGSFDVESIYYAGGYGRGIPIRAPVLDIVEVGAGGGSIAFLDEQKRLNVGPRSAGSNPGPVAYARGGVEPTVTDANLILGRIDPNRFQGGEMRLDVASARNALAERLAKPLDYRGEEGMLTLASGILSIAAVKMSEAIKRITVQRGLDPRGFILFAYGGGGPLHAVELARELSIPTVVIPPEAGNFSAIGMLLADIRRDEGRTFLRRLDDDGVREINEALAIMEAKMGEALARDFGKLPVAYQRATEMRFVGQYHTVRIELGDDDFETLRRRFLETYRARYGHAIDRAPIEVVSLHCTATAKTARPDIKGLAGDLPARAPETVVTRPIVFPGQESPCLTKVFSRRSLPFGYAAQGPAVIEEYGSTTLIGPDDRFAIGELGEIRIDLGQG
jgi:N-methylhydantoinase A